MYMYVYGDICMYVRAYVCMYIFNMPEIISGENTVLYPENIKSFLFFQIYRYFNETAECFFL